MDNKLFREICDLVYENCGIKLKEGKEALVTSRINKRLLRLKIPTIQEYIKFLKEDNSKRELGNLIDVITTNTTHFFREENSLAEVQKAFEGWLLKGKKKFRVWCAAASTGEEPYTIGMLFNELLGIYNISNVDFKLLATDISPTVLGKAMLGKYSEKQVEKIPKVFRTRYFNKVKQGGESFYFARDVIKNNIMFRQFNLLEKEYPFENKVDMILCRNVMIYFDEKTRVEIVNKMHELLPSGGYFIVGNSETLAGKIVDFKTVKPAVYIRK